MLGDEIIEDTKAGLSILGNAVRNTVKGALIFGAIALGTALVLAAGSTIAAGGLIGAGGLFSGAFVADLTANAAGIGMFAGTAAVIGGALAGACSLLPGSGTIRSLFRRKPHAVQDNSSAASQAPARGMENAPAASQTSTTRETTYMPAYPQAAPAQAALPPTINVDASHKVIRNEAPRVGVMPMGDAPLTAADQTPALSATATTEAQNAPAENSYFQPGKGAELLRRGNERESALAK